MGARQYEGVHLMWKYSELLLPIMLVLTAGLVAAIGLGLFAEIAETIKSVSVAVPTIPKESM